MQTMRGGEPSRECGLRKVLLLLSLLGVWVPGFAQQPLPNLQIDLDGQPVSMGPVMLELNTYLLPIRDAVRVATKERGSLTVEPGKSFDVIVDGQVRVRIPASAKDGTAALVYGSGGPSDVVRRVPVEVFPFEHTPKGGSPTTFVDAELLCSSLGITVDVDQAKMSLLTPEYWSRQVGIDADKIGDRMVLNLQNLPDFGISPPARTILCWLRPSRPGFAQAYRIESSRPEPMLGVNALGDPVEVLTTNDTAHMRGFVLDRPLRFETYNYGDTLGKTVSFVSIVTTRDLGKKDPVAAINAGELKPEEWAIVGLRQRVTGMPVLFENRVVAPGEDLAAFAERNKSAPSILRTLNGIGQGERLAPGTKLCVLIGLDENRIAESQKSRYEFKGLYEVQNGDTLKSLAESWGVTPDDVMAANPSLPAGAEPEPGDLVNVISRKDGQPTKAEATSVPLTKEDTAFSGTAVTLVSVDVRQTSQPGSAIVGQIPKNKFVEVLGKVGSNEAFRVRFDELMGFVPGGAIRLRSTEVTPDPPPENAPPPPPQNDLLAREALRFLGTPYRWGGNSLTRGIDCSHYVAQIYNRIGWKVPPPPVITQETIGAIVHCKPGRARRGGQTIVLPNSTRFPYAASNMRSLKPGDRIIFQRGLTDASGTRHTGIYLGGVPKSWQRRFGAMPYAFAHASSSRGVTVGSLTSRYYWNIYRFSVRSQR